MSVTPKSVTWLAKSVRPWADPVPLNTTCRPCAVPSEIHWLTAFDDQVEPEP